MKQRVQLTEGGQPLTVMVDGDTATTAGSGHASRVTVRDDGWLSVAGAASDLAGICARGPGTVWVQINGHVLEFQTDAAGRGRSSAHGHERLTPPM